MTLEQRLEKLEQQMQELKAANLVQAAEIGALRVLLHSLDTSHKLAAGHSAQPELCAAAFAVAKAKLLGKLLQTEPDKAVAYRAHELLASPSLDIQLDWS